MTAALQHRGLRWIGVLYGVGSALDWALAMALMVVVYERTGSPAAAGVMLVCAQIIPAAILMLLGARVDRWSFRTPLAIAFGAQAALVVSVALFPVPLYGAAVLIGLAGAIVRAQLRSGLALLAGQELLREGSALLNGVRGVTSLLGPALAALALSGFGSAPTLVGVGVALAGAGFLTLRAPFAGSGTSPQVEAADEDGLRGPDPGDRTQLLLLGVVALMLAALSVDEPILLAYVERELQGGVAGYGALLTAWGAGMLVGTALFARLIRQPLAVVFVGASLVSGLAHLGLAMSSSMSVALVFAVIGGISGGIDWAALSTLIMERAPRGRSASVATRLEAVATAAPGIGFVAGGLLASALSPRAVLLIPAAYGLLVFIAAGVWWTFSRRAEIPAVALPRVQPNATPRGI